MSWIRHIIHGFLAGEISPMLSGRTETDQYAYGLESCVNFVPINEGPLVKRPGFAYIREAAASSTFLTAFRRGVTQEYAVEWCEEAWRFFTNGGRIETSPGVAYEVATPYPAAKAREICAQQNYDRQYLFHAEFPMAAMRRDTATTFAHEVLELIDGPFADGNSDKTITVTASATSGSVTLTASSAIFTADHVGALFRLEAKDLSGIPMWEQQAKDVAAGSYCQNEGKVYQTTAGGNTGTRAPVHTEGTEYDGSALNDLPNDKGPYGVQWTYIHDRFGIGEITAIGGGGTTATVTVLRRLPNSLTSVASWRWAHQAISAAAGYPHLGTIAFGRLVAFKGFEVLGSVVGDYGGGRVNFAAFTDVGVVAEDLAFRRTISIEEPGVWLARDKSRILLGLPQREVAIGQINAAAAFSGTNIACEDHSFYGSEAVWPVQVGTETIAIERGGQRIRSIDFDFARDRYDATDLTASAGHICGPRNTGGVLQLAHQRGPQALVYGVRGDGQLVVHSKSRLEIKGFSRTVLGGAAQCLSAVSIYGEDGRTEELWALVERTAGDGVTTLREIWKQMPWWELGTDQSEQFYVDGGVRIEAIAGQTTFTGLEHLAGHEVAVLVRGAVVTGKTVSEAGVLTLASSEIPPSGAFVVMVGLAYTAEAVTLPPAVRTDSGTTMGLLQRVLKVATRVIETMGLKVGVPGNDRLEEVINRRPSNAMDAPIPLRTDDVGGEVEAEFDRLGRARWVSSDPVNAIVAAAMLNLEVSSKDV